MTHTLEQFSSACHDLLAKSPGPEGRKQICALLEDVLRDKDFVARHLGPGTPERQVIYEDPELGFCILAHAYQGAKDSAPHDHGPSWAIYGQASGETVMSDWERVEPATAEKPGKARHLRDYVLKPGMARLYNEGDMHSPRRAGPTRLIRIEGTNMDRIKRLRYERV
ncbi:MAG TPA: hypothetical protein VMC10_06705 [Stellaceae bacterium]|nr:hypothetical protein [Stellaceae bacterium]